MSPQANTIRVAAGKGSNIAPSAVFRVYGMRRSGNHAVINWLLRNGPDGGSVFFNNCRPGRDPIKTNKSVEVFVDGVERTVAGDMPLSDRLAEAGQTPAAFVSVEDAMPPEIADGLDPLWPKRCPDETVIVIYRSFLNWSASLLHKLMGNDAFGPLWRARTLTQACKGYMAALDRVGTDDGATDGVIGINYDRWFTDETYRSATLDRLGFAERDNGLGGVSRYGRGSSFQSDEKDPAKLATLSRADVMADDPEYKLLLWLVSNDPLFMERLTPVYPEDAKRLLMLRDNAQIWAALPMGEIA